MSKRKRTKDCDHRVQLGIEEWTKSDSKSKQEKMASKTNTCKVADLEFDSSERRYEDYTDHVYVCFSINGYCERFRATTNTNFVVGWLN